MPTVPLNGAMMRFYCDCSDEQERRDLVGTVFLFSTAWSCLFILLTNIAGAHLLDHIYNGVRFEPYLRLGTWLALFNSLSTLPLALIQMQQRPVLHRFFTLSTFLGNTAFTLLFVAGLRMGVLGFIMGQLTGSMLSTFLLLAFMRRHMNLVLKPRVLKLCLTFSLPLLVYACAGWFMDWSNRIIVERHVNLAQLGLFNVGSQFAMLLGLLLGAVGMAYTPLFYQTARTERAPATLARFGLLYFAGTTGVALVISAFSQEVVRGVTQPEFHPAFIVVPILTVTQALTCVWHLIIGPLMLKKKTFVIMNLTILSALVSVGSSLWLIPRYGIIGAALSPLIANLVLNASAFAISIRLYPVPYKYSQFAVIAGTAFILYFLAVQAGFADALLSLAAKCVVLSVYPAILFGTGIVRLSHLRRFSLADV